MTDCYIVTLLAIPEVVTLNGDVSRWHRTALTMTFFPIPKGVTTTGEPCTWENEIAARHLEGFEDISLTSIRGLGGRVGEKYTGLPIPLKVKLQGVSWLVLQL